MRYYFLLGGKNDYGRFRISRRSSFQKTFILQELYVINNVENVEITRKFSDPIELIEKYREMVRVGILLSSAAGNDLLLMKI